MTLDAWYWLCMAIWLIFGIWKILPLTDQQRYPFLGGHILQFVLFVFIGLRVFGSPFKG